MYCPHCGTRTQGSDGRFCRECGKEITEGTASNAASGAPQETGSGWQRASWTTPQPQPFLIAPVVVRGRTMPWGWMVLGLLLLPIAIPLVLGTAVAGVFASVALIGLALKTLPLILFGLLIYGLFIRPRRPRRSHW